MASIYTKIWFAHFLRTYFSVHSLLNLLCTPMSGSLS